LHSRILLVAVLFCCGAGAEQEVPGKKSSKKGSKKASKKKAERKGWTFDMLPRPSLRYGRSLRVDVRTKLHFDFRAVEPDSPPDYDLFRFRRRRVGIEGNFLRDFEYELEAELSQLNPETAVGNPLLQDAFVTWRRLRWLQVQGGRFKIPFGREQLSSPTNLDFVLRSRLGAELSPGREIGVMLHGPLLNRRFRYEAGAFRHDGQNSYAADNQPSANLTWAGRLRSEPAQWAALPPWLRKLELGAAFTRSDVPDGRNSLRGRTTFRTNFFPRANVKGARVRTGVEAEWSHGPVGLIGEYARITEQRREQSIRLANLSDLAIRSWFLTGTWLLTGEEKQGGLQPRRPFLQGWGFGAVELAIRKEFTGFSTPGATGPPSSNPRSDHLLPASDRAWTFGVNWYWNRYVKIQINFLRETPVPQIEAPGLPRQIYWNRIARIQFVI